MTETAVLPESPHGQRTRRVAWAWVLGVALVLTGLSGWSVAAGSAAGKVSVSWSGPPRCAGAEYAPVRGVGPRPAIHARRASTCTITVVVSNDGARTVHLDRLVAPYMGPSGGSVLRADPQPPVSDEQRRLGDDTDAHYRLDRDLEAGQTYRFEITLGFREQGCSHARTTLSGFPTLELTVFGRGPIEASAEDDLVFIQQGPSSECRAP